MRRTLQQLVSQTRVLIDQTDSTNSNFTDSELTGFLNEALQFGATQCGWPRDQIQVQVESNVGSYTLPSDFLSLRNVYFGDPTTNGDVRPIAIMTEEQLRERYPNWLETGTTNNGRPVACFLLDRATVHIYPRPNATESASGKYLILSYTYYPAAMSADGDYPDLPDAYHDYLKFYAGHLCYAGKLKNAERSKEYLDLFIKQMKLQQPEVINQEGNNNLYFGWGNYEGGANAEGNLANGRLS